MDADSGERCSGMPLLARAALVWSGATTVALVGLGRPAAAGAQAFPSVTAEGTRAAWPVADPAGAVGMHVRFRAPTEGRWCEGRVSGHVGDTVRVALSRPCDSSGRVPDVFRVGATAELQVQDGGRGSRSRHALLGSAVGLLAGAVVSVAANSGHRRSNYDGEAGAAAAYGAVLGAGAGLLAGGLVGALLPAGPEWVAAGPPRPVRVAGLVLRPGMRVALGPRRP